MEFLRIQIYLSVEVGGNDRLGTRGVVWVLHHLKPQARFFLLSQARIVKVSKFVSVEVFC